MQYVPLLFLLYRQYWQRPHFQWPSLALPRQHSTLMVRFCIFFLCVFQWLTNNSGSGRFVAGTEEQTPSRKVGLLWFDVVESFHSLHFSALQQINIRAPQSVRDEVCRATKWLAIVMDIPHPRCMDIDSFGLLLVNAYSSASPRCTMDRPTPSRIGCVIDCETGSNIIRFGCWFDIPSSRRFQDIAYASVVWFRTN